VGEGENEDVGKDEGENEDDCESGVEDESQTMNCCWVDVARN
jgi:hypothetical protein